MGIVFANGPGDRASIPGRVIPKTLKMALDISLLNTQQYKVRNKGKVEQSRERGSALGFVAIEKGAFWSPSTTVTNLLYTYWESFVIYNCIRGCGSCSGDLVNMECHFIALTLGSHWLWVKVTVRVPPMGQICRFENYSYWIRIYNCEQKYYYQIGMVTWNDKFSWLRIGLVWFGFFV